MNPEIMTELLQQIIASAATHAEQAHHAQLTCAHVLQAMLEDDSLDTLLERLRVDKAAMKQMADEETMIVLSGIINSICPSVDDTD